MCVITSNLMRGKLSYELLMSDEKESSLSEGDIVREDLSTEQVNNLYMK